MCIGGVVIEREQAIKKLNLKGMTAYFINFGNENRENAE